MLKSKSFYVSCACVLCAVAVVGITSATINNDKNDRTEEEKSYLGDDYNTDENNEVLDISDQIGNETSKTREDMVPGSVANKGETQSVLQDDINNELNKELEGDKSKDDLGNTQSEKNENNKEEVTKENDKTNEKKDTKKTDSRKEELVFNEEAGLVWPIEGEVIMEFSGDSMVYYKTLGQFMKSDKILIGAAVGDRVKACASGTIKDITSTRETGKTVTISIGSGYNVIYGELDNITVKKGDTVKAGQIIGTVAVPSGYYSREGTNLYFKVMEGDKPVNPMYLLK